MIVEEVPVDQYDLSSLGDLVYGRVFTVHFTAEVEGEDGSLVVSDVIPADNVQVTISTDAPALGELDTKVALDLDRDGAYVLQESADSEFVFTAGQIGTVGLFVVDGEPEVEEIPVFAHELTAEVSGMIVKVEAADAAMIPEKAQLVVEEVPSETYADVLSSLTNVKASHFLKFAIKNEITAEDGTVTPETILPASTVTVTVTVPDEIKTGYKKIALNPVDGSEYVLVESESNTFTFEAATLDTVGLIVKSEYAEELTASINDASVIIAAGEDAGIPETAVLSLEEIPVGTPEYLAYRNDAASHGEALFARFFKLSLTNADGTPVVLTAPVSVELSVNLSSDYNNGIKAALDMDSQSRKYTLAESAGNVFAFDTQTFGTVGTVYYSNYKDGVLNYKGADYEIKVTYKAKAEIPEAATLSVRELTGKEYDDYVAMIEEMLGDEATVSTSRLFDITIMNDGVEVEPKVPVDVDIKFAEVKTKEGDDVKVVHFEEDKTQGAGGTTTETNTAASASAPEEKNAKPVEITDVTKNENTSGNVEGVSFSANGFSIYAVFLSQPVTVDFLSADGNTYKITVTFDEREEIPNKANLEVKEILEGTDEYQEYVDKSATAIGDESNKPDVKFARVFDISIRDEEKEYEPQYPVDVKIEYAEAKDHEEDDEVSIVHFAEKETEVLESTPVTENEQTEGVEFQTNSFSIYAVVIIDKEAGNFIFEDDNYKVTVSYAKEANIPIGTKLTVREITDIDEYDNLWDQTIEKINEGVEWENPDEPDPRKGLCDAVFFDISLNYEGKDFEPEVPLGVKIEFKNRSLALQEDGEAKIVHFAKNDIEIIDEVETKSTENKMPEGAVGTTYIGSYEYQQQGFSPVGAVTTGEYNTGSITGSPLKLSAPMLKAAAQIAASKSVTDPDGDGVYELALNVTGASESSSSTTVNKSNVVLVIDTSGSMDEDTYTPYTYSADTYDSSKDYYRQTNNGYAEVWYWPGGSYGGAYHAAGWYRNNSWTSHTGTVYLGQTRMDATIDAAKDLVTALLANNKPEGTTADDGTRLDDIVEISLITFANGTTARLKTPVSMSTSETELHNAIDAMSANGGTNWEAALSQANVEAAKYTGQTGETTSIIFLTDGVPTRRGYPNEWSDPNGSETRENTHSAWEGAAPAARQLITNGYRLYSIFAFGTDTTKYSYDGYRTDADYLRALVNYAYTGSGSYSNTVITQYVRDYFFNASDTTALTRAFQAIIDSINNTVGYGGVEYDDGVTLGVTNTSVSVDGTVHEGSFRYAVRDSAGTIVYTVKIANGTATFSIPGKGDHTDNSPKTVTTKIDENDQSTWIESQVYSVEVDGVTYQMSPASINTDNGMVEWDLAGLGILQNGYTYTVAFDVWPNQYSYDLVADLNNGVKTLAQIRQELINEHGEEAGIALYNQIEHALIGPDANNQYAIRTNYEQKVDYYTVNQEEDDEGNITTTYSEKQTKNVDFDDEIALTSKPLPMVKIWNSNLSPDQIGNLLYSDYPTNSVSTEYQVTLHLWKADTAAELQNLIDQYAGNPTTASANDYIGKTLGWNGTEYDWEDSVSIAPGTMVSLQTAIDMGINTTSEEHQKNIVTYEGAQYYIIEKGHYYYVTEDNIDWHFELETVLYHPMNVNGRLKNVTFITDDDGNITGVDDIVDMTQVSASNSKTAELDITKKVVDNTEKMTQAQMDAETFTYKVTLTVPVDADMSHTNALEWVARYNDDASASNRYYVFGYQTSEDAEVLGLSDDVERFNGKVYGQYTVSYPGGGATLDEIFTNDPDGTTKSGTIYITLKQNEIIRFTNLPSGTQYRIEEMYNNLYQADPSRDADANLGDSAPASNIEANGYTVTVATKNGNPSVSGRVVTGTIDKLNKRYYNQFKNTLNDTAVVNLSVTKHLQGYEWRTDERYYVKLAASDGNTPLPRITTRYLSAASGSADVSFNFGSVHLSPGTYTYTITETAEDFTEVYSGTVRNGITYDAVKTIIVTVADDLSVSIAEGSSEGVTYDSGTNTVKTKVTNKVIPLSIYKFGGSGVSSIDNKLVGVQFKLYSDSALTQPITTDARGSAIGTNGVITTGNDGTAKIGVLNTGTYYLVETDLGNNGGYNKLTSAVEITVGDNIHYKQIGWSPSEQYNSDSTASSLVKTNGGMYINYADDGTTISGYTFTINNNTGVSLPSTGSTGTKPYTLSGLALIIASALLYGFRMRRRERRCY